MKTLAQDPTQQAPVRPGVRSRPRVSGRVFSLDGTQRCPLCHDAVRSGELLIACRDCGALYHGECHAGRCATLGCPGAEADESDPPPAPAPRSRSERLRPFSGSFLAFLALLSLSFSVGAYSLRLAMTPTKHGIGCLAERPVPVPRELTPKPAPEVIFSPVIEYPVWIELAPEQAWSPTGDYRLRGELHGEGEAEVVVTLNSQEVMRYRALAPAPLDLLLPLRSGRNVVRVDATATAASGQRATSQISKVLLGH